MSTIHIIQLWGRSWARFDQIWDVFTVNELYECLQYNLYLRWLTSLENYPKGNVYIGPQQGFDIIGR